jgi:hypothetical protein
MNEILTEIKEVLKMSPARFAKIYFRAVITPVSLSTIKVEIVSTFDYFGSMVFPVPPYEQKMEKWHATGIAIGALEHYLDNKQFKYHTTISSDPTTEEITAEILINV